MTLQEDDLWLAIDSYVPDWSNFSAFLVRGNVCWSTGATSRLGRRLPLSRTAVGLGELVVGHLLCEGS